MKREWLIRVLVWALVLALAAWVVSRTEWVDVEIPGEMSGEAARNPLYVTQQMLRRLGVQVVERNNLNELPPPGATLLLTSGYWDLFPQRAQALRAWVEAGGHLVVQAHMLDRDGVKDWVPIEASSPSDDEDDDDDEAPGKGKGPFKPGAQAPSPPASAAAPSGSGTCPAPAKDGKGVKDPKGCRLVSEPEGIAPAYPQTQAQVRAGGRLRLCGYSSWWRLTPRRPPLWSLAGADGIDVLRVGLGRGTVTATRIGNLLTNLQMLESDNALGAMAMLQAQRGAVVWFVDEEARPPLLPWLWQQGWVAVLLLALAAVAGLWRGAPRFGPPHGPLQMGRRSMVEQIAGTAEFLGRRGAGGLQAAQLRALDETARLHLRDYNQLSLPDRAAAIAQLSGLDAAALQRAMQPAARLPHAPAAPTLTELPYVLALLETARRRMRAARAHAARRDF